MLTSSGPKPLSTLNIGEEIASLDSSGDVVFSEVIAFMDYAPTEKRQFVRLSTSSGRHLTLTPAHLVPVEFQNRKSPSDVIYAGNVQVGDRILVRDEDYSLPGDSRLRWDDVIEAKLVLESGVYAPLTREGTLVVDNVVASCYAIVNSQTVAQVSFLPLRIWATVANGFRSAKNLIWEVDSPQPRNRPSGIHWYANLLYSISAYVLPPSMLY